MGASHGESGYPDFLSYYLGFPGDLQQQQEEEKQEEKLVEEPQQLQQAKSAVKTNNPAGNECILGAAEDGDKCNASLEASPGRVERPSQERPIRRWVSKKNPQDDALHEHSEFVTHNSKTNQETAKVPREAQTHTNQQILASDVPVRHAAGTTSSWSPETKTLDSPKPEKSKSIKKGGRLRKSGKCTQQQATTSADTPKQTSPIPPSASRAANKAASAPKVSEHAPHVPRVIPPRRFPSQQPVS